MGLLPAQQGIAVRRGLLPQRLHERGHRRPAHRIGPEHHPVGQQLREFFRQEPDEVRVQVGRETGQEPNPGAGPGGLHVDEDVGGAQPVPHGGHQPPRGVQIVHLQHRIDEVDQ